MKQFLYILILLLSSCSQKVDEDFIVKNEQELLSIIKASLKSKINILEAKENTQIANQLRTLGIQKVEIKYKASSIDFINADSIIYFSFENTDIFEPSKYIVYDFSTSPRKWGDQENPGAAYTRKQVSDRWYYETIGFD